MSDSWQMSAEDAEEYTRALGQIMSGGWRQIALAQRLRVPEALGMTTEAWVRERIGGYVRLGLEERRATSKALTDPEGEYGFTQREAADVLGVDVATVNRDLHHVADATPAETTLEDDGERAVADATSVEPPEGHGGDASRAEDTDEGIAAAPTAGDVHDDIADGLDEEALAADTALTQHLRVIRNTRIGWLRFMNGHTPGSLIDGMGLDEIREVVRDLERFIGWLEQARECAVAARRPRRVGV